MSKQTQHSEKQTDKTNKPTPTPKPRAGATILAEMPNGLMEVGGLPTIQGQASRLTDKRLPDIQRQTLATQIARGQGNRHMQTVMAAVEPSCSSNGNPIQTANGHWLQPKLAVNKPDDEFEQEADVVADAVMRMPDPAEELANLTAAPYQIQGSEIGVPTVTPELEASIMQVQGGGAPLPDAEQTFFESRMGADFSDVRLHTGSQAIETTQALQARAYTVGSNIAFNAGEYHPGSSEGKRLIAHELTHVVQHEGGKQLQAKFIQKNIKAGPTSKRSQYGFSAEDSHRESTSTIHIQREETSNNEHSDPDQLDAELDALLEEIFGKTPKIPTFEAITSTTSGEYSGGELELNIERLWRREQMSFTQAARHTAQNDGASESTPRATQSPQFEPSEPYAARWTVNLFAADYQSGSDLPDVAELTRRGSPFQQSLAAEFDRVILVKNPTANDMDSQIFDAIHDLWLSLEENQIGELVVTFSGHGRGGFIGGVDGESLSPEDLSNLAELAQGFNIHIIYILDTCRAGLLANFAQAAAVHDLQESISNLPEDQHAPLQAHIDGIRRIGSLGNDINICTILFGDAVKVYRKKRTSENYLALFNSLTDLFDKAEELGDFLQQDASFLHGVSNLATLKEQQQDLLLAVIVAFNGNRTATNEALRSAAVLLDELNDSINEAVMEAYSLASAKPNETEQDEQAENES